MTLEILGDTRPPHASPKASPLNADTGVDLVTIRAGLGCRHAIGGEHYGPAGAAV